MAAVAKNELLHGALEMLVLRVLEHDGPLHGYGIGQRIHLGTDGILEIEEGSLYPALHRLERRGWVRSTWGTSENNRRAKYYRLTRSGRNRLGEVTASWVSFAGAVTRLMEGKS